MPRKSNGIDVDALDQEIRDLGIRVRLFKSTVCPNFKSLESIDHDINCTVCDNNMIDFDCRETMMLVQQQDFKQLWAVQGTFSIDEVMGSFLSSETLQHYAKVEVLDYEEDFFEAVQRQEGTDVDALKYKACKVLGVFTVVADSKVRFHEGADFEIDVNGNIKWIGTHKPDDRQIYSIYYQYHPVFRAVKAVHRTRYSQYNVRPNDIKAPKKTVNGSTFVKLPECWILKRDYLVDRKDSDGDPLPKNQYYDPNEA